MPLARAACQTAQNRGACKTPGGFPAKSGSQSAWPGPAVFKGAAAGGHPKEGGSQSGRRSGSESPNSQGCRAGAGRKRRTGRKVSAHREYPGSDFWHKMPIKLCREHQAMGIGTLSAQGMMQNHRLAQAIADQGSGQSFTMRKYRHIAELNWPLQTAGFPGASSARLPAAAIRSVHRQWAAMSGQRTVYNRHGAACGTGLGQRAGSSGTLPL